jgi:hypothetical protein
VPFTSFSEFNAAAGGDIRFALDKRRPSPASPGSGRTGHRCERESETTNDLFGFLPTEPNDVVAPIHPKVMSLILTKLEEIETWMTAPATQALKLQRPLPDGVIGGDMFEDESRNRVWSSSIMR